MAEKITNLGQLQLGEIYEDCDYHPCLCIRVDGYEVFGISLIDGSYPRNCEIGRCGLVKLSIAEAIESKGRKDWWKELNGQVRKEAK